MVLAVASRFSDPQWATHGGGLAFTALALGSACCTVLDSAVNGASSSPVQLEDEVDEVCLSFQWALEW
eukprot:CAMPEP_0169079658 /NCGR_PEP_ID=MMETSP1015-20121227/10063_1 /TAXON_ID=342587 /ORGANISM="Karlodinium micrum, Strain CCMP2283" /LENGTH=67 /DNA_ID=CAMNT_0009139331 /DNA_START=116 /DNA_END=316 /DNA_ORIENTATION=-